MQSTQVTDNIYTALAIMDIYSRQAERGQNNDKISTKFTNDYFQRDRTGRAPSHLQDNDNVCTN